MRDKTLDQVVLDTLVERLIKYYGHREMVARSMGICIRTVRNLMNRNLDHPIIKRYKGRRDYFERPKDIDFLNPDSEIYRPEAEQIRLDRLLKSHAAATVKS